LPVSECQRFLGFRFEECDQLLRALVPKQLIFGLSKRSVGIEYSLELFGE
jgi:hypothetical protein